MFIIPGYVKGLDHHSPFWFDDQTVGFLSTMSGTQQLHQVGIIDGVVTQVTNLPLGKKYNYKKKRYKNKINKKILSVCVYVK